MDMPLILTNENIELTLDLPTEGYSNTRFDWSGKIIDVKYRGISICGCEVAAKPYDPYYGRGLYNEFGIHSPLGYSNVEKGEDFHKIGVGVLTKDDENYDFLKKYPFKPDNFDIRKEKGEIIISVESHKDSLYNYKLTKKICLQESGFEIKYNLDNTGDKPIKTTEYNHNFLNIGGHLLDNHYKLTFPFTLDQNNFEEIENPEDNINVDDHSFNFPVTPSRPFFFSYLNGKEPTQGVWTLENAKEGIRISEECDFMTKKINLWGSSHVICPEVFYEIELEPKYSDKWTRRYSINEL